MQTSYDDAVQFLESYYPESPAKTLLDVSVKAGCASELWAIESAEGEIGTRFVVILPVRVGYEVQLSPLQVLLASKDKPVGAAMIGAVVGQAIRNFRVVTRQLAVAAATGDLNLLQRTFVEILQRPSGYSYKVLTLVGGEPFLGEWTTPAKQ